MLQVIGGEPRDSARLFEVAPTFAAVSVARAVKTRFDFAVPGADQVQVKGATVSVQRMVAPWRNSTFATE